MDDLGKCGRFRFIVYDMDGSFSESSPFTTFAGKKTYTFNALYGESVSAWTKEIEPVTIFLNMLQNASFRRHFVDAFCLVAGSVYDPERCKELINEWTDYVYPMQILNDNGYGKNASPPLFPFSPPFSILFSGTVAFSNLIVLRS